MAELEDLQERIAEALARADGALARIRPPSGADDSSLRAELEAERQAAAQLEERLRALTADREEAEARSGAEATRLRERVEVLETELASAREAEEALSELPALREREAELGRELEAARSAAEETVALREECERLREALGTQGAVAERLRKANADVTAAMKVLREAQVADLVDAHLVDKAMKKEIDALHAARDGDLAELDAILSALAPLVEEKEKQNA